MRDALSPVAAGGMGRTLPSNPSRRLQPICVLARALSGRRADTARRLGRGADGAERRAAAHASCCGAVSGSAFLPPGDICLTTRLPGLQSLRELGWGNVERSAGGDSAAAAKGFGGVDFQYH